MKHLLHYLFTICLESCLDQRKQHAGKQGPLLPPVEDALAQSNAVHSTGAQTESHLKCANML